MLVWRVGWSYWAGAGHEVARPPGCTAALVWAAPPTPHNLLSITFSIQSGTCLYKNIYIYLLSTDYIKADPLSSYHVNIFVKTICLRARYIFGCNTSRLGPNFKWLVIFNFIKLQFYFLASLHEYIILSSHPPDSSLIYNWNRYNRYFPQVDNLDIQIFLLSLKHVLCVVK